MKLENLNNRKFNSLSIDESLQVNGGTTAGTGFVLTTNRKGSDNKRSDSDKSKVMDDDGDNESMAYIDGLTGSVVDMVECSISDWVE